MSQFDGDDIEPMDEQTYNRIGSQLGELGLLDWKSMYGGGYGRITALGVDVVEGDAPSPISITLNSNNTTSSNTPISGSHDVQLKEIKDIIQHLLGLKTRFHKSTSSGYFLNTEDQAAFGSIVVEVKTLLDETLAENSDFVRQLITTVNNGSGGFMGGPSLACVSEVEQLLRGAVRTIERRQQAKPLEFAPAATKPPYVDPARIAGLQSLQGQAWDYTKLIQLCGELNIASKHDCHYAVAMLVRAITDHVPPLFKMASFKQVVANYGGSKSFKDTMAHLDSGLRKIADSFLHEQIRQREIMPNAIQVNFSQYLDLLLAEVIRTNGIPGTPTGSV
ncbi:hypothetical protein [Methylobacterium sp. WL2]|uniref:hypothetical protein n=1 Tax=Methylobacterium sp. WL2 TaxID=2603902 RepID=UPI0011C7DE52|nr:hypothetical protein [Methylobacterium sp. WL2]TXN54055.1 hypothetical protein FV241_25645 [Methylobacterium sp. WL2]